MEGKNEISTDQVIGGLKGIRMLMESDYAKEILDIAIEAMELQDNERYNCINCINKYAECYKCLGNKELEDCYESKEQEV